jgi:hypothetical protein
MGTARGQQAEGGLVCVVSLAWFHIHRLLRHVNDLGSQIAFATASWATAA